MIEREKVRSITITLEVNGAILLFVFLGADGRIERMGDGERGNLNQERDLVRGTTDQGYFHSLLGRVPSDVLEVTGSYEMPDKDGDPCRLRILFGDEENEMHGLEFEFGSDSEGPPVEVADLVHAVLDLTDPWWSERAPSPNPADS